MASTKDKEVESEVSEVDPVSKKEAGLAQLSDDEGINFCEEDPSACRGRGVGRTTSLQRTSVDEHGELASAGRQWGRVVKVVDSGWTTWVALFSGRHKGWGRKASDDWRETSRGQAKEGNGRTWVGIERLGLVVWC